MNQFTRARKQGQGQFLFKNKVKVKVKVRVTVKVFLSEKYILKVDSGVWLKLQFCLSYLRTDMAYPMENITGNTEVKRGTHRKYHQ